MEDYQVKYSKIINIILVFSVIMVIALSLLFAYKKLALKEHEIINRDNAKTYMVTFYSNGVNQLEKKEIYCKVDGNNCNVTLPKAIRNNGVVLGYSIDKNNTSADYQIGDVININDNLDLYAISYKEYKVNIDSDGVDYLSKESVSCKAFNKEDSCIVNIPSYNKIGYENRGYSTSSNSAIGFIFPNDEYKISKDVTLYPIYNVQNHKEVLNISKTLNYENSIIEVENGCNESVFNKYMEYLNEISVYAPFLLIGNKISFISDLTFDRIWGSGYVGMNYGPLSMRSVDIRCTSNYNNDFYATMVHEMSHSWDFYYANVLGDNISSQSDIINLFNKYKNSVNAPFRSYSFSNQYEFVADMMRYYYLKYYVPRVGFKDLSYPMDVKNTLEKYICISKNNYDESKCG